MDEHSRWGRRNWKQAILHYSRFFLIGYYAISIAYTVLGTHLGGWMGVVRSVICLFTLYCIISHDAKLCEVCMSNFPLDPDAAVAKRRGWLRGFHIIDGRILSLPRGLLLFSLIILSPVVVVQILEWAGVLSVKLGYRIASPTMYVLLALWYMGTWHHNRLQPWCPWCRDGDDGRESAEPEGPPGLTIEPQPAGSKS